MYRLPVFPGHAAAVALIVVGAMGFTAPPARSADDGGLLSILVMGDSYSAGNGAGGYYGARKCRRSSRNYGRVFQRLVETAPYKQNAFVQTVACSGDTTREITKEKAGRRAQIVSVDRGYDIVFVTLGGNDVDFDDIVKQCLVGKTDKASECNKRLGEAEKALKNDTLETKLRHALTAVQARMDSRSKLVLLSYPYLEGDKNYKLKDRKLTVKVGARLKAVQDAGDKAQRAVVATLNAARPGSAVFVDTKPMFLGPPDHSLYAARTNKKRWFIQPFKDASIVGRDTFYHPNPTGWKKLAALLIRTPEVPKSDVNSGVDPTTQPAPVVPGALVIANDTTDEARSEPGQLALENNKWLLHSLEWADWGTQTATATGRISVNLNEDDGYYGGDMADTWVDRGAITVRLSGVVSCAGRALYTSIVLHGLFARPVADRPCRAITPVPYQVRPPAHWTLSADGFGPARVGMTIREVAAATGVQFEPVAGSDHCFQGSGMDLPVLVTAGASSDTVAALLLTRAQDRLRTDTGLHAGDSLWEAKRLYGSAFRWNDGDPWTQYGDYAIAQITPAGTPNVIGIRTKDEARADFIAAGWRSVALSDDGTDYAEYPFCMRR